MSLTLTKALVFGSMLAAGALSASSAFAYHANPVNTTFTATGPTSMTALGVPIPCTSTFVLVTDGSGNVRVTAASFSGSRVCSDLKAMNLPWTVSISSLTIATIQGVSVTTPFGMRCAGNVGATVDNSKSEITLNGSLGTCTVNGTLSVTPTFSISN
ncbi:hypothetical protein [Dyella choica]|uniref:Protein activator of alkane oxidation PraB n=1 Tax=Dyella choica TaxID=1927959 RepID=A0A432MBC7_9GAMM|nr:hypothetical protein [Dyella choica]RUL80055.1 hypothetical protein EKH80_02380 [Dyella choica]